MSRDELIRAAILQIAPREFWRMAAEVGTVHFFLQGIRHEYWKLRYPVSVFANN